MTKRLGSWLIIATMLCAGCHKKERPITLLCAAKFHDLQSSMGPEWGPGMKTINRLKALYFLDRTPGDRTENIAKVKELAPDIYSNKGIRGDTCEKLIPKDIEAEIFNSSLSPKAE